MSKRKRSVKKQDWKEIIKEDTDILKPLIKEVLEQVLEADMEETLGAKKGERTGERLGYRSGYKYRSLVTRVGKLDLRVPQDRHGLFSTEVFERYQRSEKALVSALMEMYVQGVSTRKVKAITEELCGYEFSASAVSLINKKMDEELTQFANRPLKEATPYLMVDARYERIREAGVIRHQAVMVAVGVNWEGKRQVLAVEISNRESESSWREFLMGLKKRGLKGVELVVSDHHAGLKKAIREIIPEAVWQRCYVHFLRNSLDYLPRKIADDSLTELRWIYQRKNIEEARRDLVLWLKKWQKKYPKLCNWVEENIEETLSFYRFPCQHHKNIKSTNMIERINEEIKRRTLVVRIFPNQESCMRLIRALAVELHEDWMEATRYLNMDLLKLRQKEWYPLEASAA